MSLFSDLTDAIGGVSDAISPGLGSVLSAGAGYLGQSSTNDQNAAIAASNNAWSASQYANRYQTMTKDFQAAGLNPMLAYSQSAGASPTAQQVQFQNPMASATQAYHESSQRNLISAQVRNADADVQLKQAQAEAAVAQARQSNASASAQTLQMVTGNELTRAQTKSAYSQIQVNKATLPKIAQEIATGGAQAGFYSAAARKAIAEGKITEADLTRALNDQNYERVTGGAIRQTSRDLGNITGAAVNARKAGMTKR